MRPCDATVGGAGHLALGARRGHQPWKDQELCGSLGSPTNGLGAFSASVAIRTKALALALAL